MYTVFRLKWLKLTFPRYITIQSVCDITIIWKVKECCGEMHHYPKFHQNPINKVLDLYVTHLTNRSVSHGGCLLICSLWFLWYFPMDCVPVFHYFVPLSSGLHCGGEKMTVFHRKNVRTLDWNVCLKCEKKKLQLKTLPDSCNVNSIV